MRPDVLPPDLAGPVVVALARTALSIPPVTALPGGCVYELKWDGFRLVIVTTAAGSRLWTGLGIGVGLGAVAGALRTRSTTPPQPAAATALGLTALGASAAATAATGTPRDTSPAAVIGDVVAHLAYGAVAVFTLHRLLDPHTPHAHR